MAGLFYYYPELDIKFFSQKVEGVLDLLLRITKL